MKTATNFAPSAGNLHCDRDGAFQAVEPASLARVTGGGAGDIWDKVKNDANNGAVGGLVAGAAGGAAAGSIAGGIGAIPGALVGGGLGATAGGLGGAAWGLGRGIKDELEGKHKK